MGTATKLPPTTPGEGETGFETGGPLADVIPIRLGSTAITDEAAATANTLDGSATIAGTDTAEMSGKPVVDGIFDYRIHARGDFKDDEKPKDTEKPKREPQRFQKGTAERATLDAMKKHGANARVAARAAAERLTRSKDK